MYAAVISVSFLCFLVYYFVLSPLWLYLRDPKGFRKYPSMNALAGITDLGFMYEATKGFRTQRLTELHKKYPVIRIGPNHLSFTGVQAIKDIYGHGTACTKDLFYVVTGGSHTHLADVVNKADHARKRRVLSSAYAIKNLEDWEYKVADKTERFIKTCDAACTLPPKTSADPLPDELTFDYRKWTNFFTVEAIADIGLSEKLGFLDNRSADCTAEKRDGTTYTANFIESLHNTAIAQSRLVWGYSWYKTNEFIARLFSSNYRRRLRLGDQFDDIVYHRATKRLARYRAGERLDDFF
ncbi:benzoate 4-monooxygenase cytochrome p450 [Fusarium albosuccineum]|uniref:Benzoate 4-monooxygenase cytochrome p450 n=1 Tax=Fusarium albosuccineum TaxID=1237068 RepID=A0A8H4PBK1_9HYPO|nr:benzoate 4-monooxygenase cytochrome p450 [Fusarium albosuccineum]